MALPIPIAQTAKCVATIKFNGQGGGWSESVHRAFTPTPPQDPINMMENVMVTYLADRLKVLCSSNTAARMTIHVLGQTLNSKPYVQPQNGLGPGLVTGEPAGLDEGLQVHVYDSTRRVSAGLTYGGFAAVDLGITTSSARDRGITATRVINWRNFLLNWYEDTNGIYAYPGVPFMTSYAREIEWKDAELIQEWRMDDTLGVMQILTNNDLEFDRGDTAIIHCGKNPYVRSVGGEYMVLETSIDPDGFLTTIRKHPCAPLANYNLTISRVQKRSPEYYATHDLVTGLWVRRENGAGFSARAGRRSARC